MENEIVKIDPSEFGLEAKAGKSIEDHFKPAIVEREGLTEVYKNVIIGELTQELSVEAGTLRKKLVKVRTHIDKIHKTEKEYFWAGGKFVDAMKNRHTAPVLIMEEKLKEIEKHWENEEKKRVQVITDERTAEITKYISDPALIPPDLGKMEDSVWENYLVGNKAQFEAREEEDRKAAEKSEEERKARELHNQRYEESRDWHQWIPKETPTDLSQLSVEEFNDLAVFLYRS